MTNEQIQFPSPCGDKLQWLVLKLKLKNGKSFRPLAGINCNLEYLEVTSYV